ncbi:MAG: MarR family transcriptional regulator, partial [Planctomycetota bacterium]|nr:MarR family transcriptional regulator [Planctomycetota bacterium]
MPGGKNLQTEIGKKQPFEQPAAEAFLNIMRTASLLSGEFEHVFKADGLTSAMYNALRILRGAGERGRMCHEIGEQMISRVPDVTRLVDRLENLGLAQRARCGEDRRVIYVTISAKG